MADDESDERRESGADTVRSQRWRLIRDVVIFVTKASLEALRDIALIPAAVIAGVAGMLISPSKPDRYFQRVLEIGDEFDEFIDLFGKEKRRESGSRFDPPGEGESPLRVDDIFERIEQVMFDEYKQGGVTAQAKQAIDRGLDAVHEALEGARTSESDRPDDSDRLRADSDDSDDVVDPTRN
jgi:hypothetical protein